MTQNTVSKEERDYAFSAGCYPYCEGFIGSLKKEQEEELKKSMVENNIDLQNCYVRGEHILFFAIHTLSPALLKFFIDNGAPLLVTNHENKGLLEVALEELVHLESTLGKERRVTRLARACVDYLEGVIEQQQ